MPKYPIDEIEAGMVLSEPAVGPNSNVLIGADIELSERMIQSLRSRGISAVSVVGEEDEDAHQAIELSTESLADAAEQLAPRYCHADREHPAIAFLFDYTVRQLATELMSGQISRPAAKASERADSSP